MHVLAKVRAGGHEALRKEEEPPEHKAHMGADEGRFKGVRLCRDRWMHQMYAVLHTSSMGAGLMSGRGGKSVGNGGRSGEASVAADCCPGPSGCFLNVSTCSHLSSKLSMAAHNLPACDINAKNTLGMHSQKPWAPQSAQHLQQRRPAGDLGPSRLPGQSLPSSPWRLQMAVSQQRIAQICSHEVAMHWQLTLRVLAVCLDCCPSGDGPPRSHTSNLHA